MSNPLKLSSSIHTTPPKYGYSAIKVAENVTKTFYVAGQVSIDDNGEVCNRDDIEAQIRICFQRIEKLLKENGAGLDNVMMLRAYVLNMRDHFDEYLTVLKEYFPGAHPPASTFVEVPRLALDGLLVEIDAIAAI